MLTLADKITRRISGLTFFSFTPPRLSTPQDKLDRINRRRSERLSQINPDGVMIYDVQEEKDRTDEERTFSFHPYHNSIEYADSFLDWNPLPQIRYAAVSRYSRETLTKLFDSNTGHPIVAVGYPGEKEADALSLLEAYALHRQNCYDFPMGGIAIAERHLNIRNEAQAMIWKAEQGVNFFVSQCIYDPDLFIRLMQDYKSECIRQKQKCRMIILSFSPVIDEKDISFLEWLGVSVPPNFKKRIAASSDRKAFAGEYLSRLIIELTEYCKAIGIPYAVNIESIIARKAETDLAAEILQNVSANNLILPKARITINS